MKQKRGIRVIVGILLGILVLSQVGFFAPVGTVKAASSATFPPDLATLFTQYSQKASNDWYGDGPSQLSPAAFYTKYIQGQTPSSFSGNSAINFDDDWSTTFDTVYNTAYSEVSKIDALDWNDGGMWKSLVALEDFNGTNYNDGQSVDQYNKDAQAFLDYVTQQIFPDLANVYALLQTEVAFSQNTDAAQGFQTLIGGDAHTYAERISDLDTTSIIIAGVDGGQTKRIFQPTNLTTATSGADQTNPLNKSTSQWYTSLETYYSDLLSFLNAVSGSIPATDAAGVQTSQSAIKTALASATSNASTTTTAGGQNGQCGSAAGTLEVVKAIGQALCGLVITWAQFNETLVVGAGNILAVMVPLPGGGAPNGLASFIPVVIQPQTILDNLNAVPFVALTIILVNRIIGFLIIFALLVVALANILQIQINIYAIKKAVPALVIGYVLALGAPFATKVCIEFSNYLASAVFSPKLNGNTTVNVATLVGQMSYVHLAPPTVNVSPPATSSSGTGSPPATTTTTSGIGGDPTTLNFSTGSGTNQGIDMQAVFQQAILNIVTLIAAVLMFVLAILFVARSLIFIVLLPLSPVAFFGITFEPLKGFWNKWWKTTQGWLFMNTVAAFWLWLMFKLVTIGTSGGSTGQLLSGIVGYAAGIVCLWFAVTTPFKMAGEAKAVYSKAEKLVNAGKDKAIYAAGAPARYARDEVAMRFNRNQAVQAIKGRFKDLKDEREKNIDYAKKGLNYGAIKKDAQKLSNLARYEEDLKNFKQAIEERDSLIATLPGKIAAATTPTERAKLQASLAKALSDKLELEERRDKMEGTISQAEDKLSYGSRRNRKNIQREMFRSKKDEIFKEKEDILKNSAQARVAQKNNKFKKMDGEVRDLRVAKDEVGYIGKSELDEAYREGFGAKDQGKMKLDRQFKAARVEASKKMDEDNANRDKVNSSVEYLFGLKDLNNDDIKNLTGEEKQGARNQGGTIRSYVEDEAKKDKGYTLGADAQANMMHEIDITNVDDKKNALDGAASLARVYYQISHNVNIENRPKIIEALKALRDRLGPGSPHAGAIDQALLDISATDADIGKMKAAVANFKSSNTGKRLEAIYKDPHEAIINKKLDDI